MLNFKITDKYDSLFRSFASNKIMATTLSVSGQTILQDLTVLGLSTYGNLIIDGNLTVNGTQTVINSEVLNVHDPITTLHYNFSGSPTDDVGFEIERGLLENVRLIWNESDGVFKCGTKNDEKQIAVLENILDDSGITIYNSTLKELQTSANLKFSQTTNTLIVPSIGSTGEILDIENRFVKLNASFTGTPSNDCGIYVNRGELADVGIIWDESVSLFKSGVYGNEKAIANVSDSIDNFGVPFYVSDNLQFETSNKFVFDNENYRLGVGLPFAPQATLHLVNNSSSENSLTIENNDNSTALVIKGNGRCLVGTSNSGDDDPTLFVHGTFQVQTTDLLNNFMVTESGSVSIGTTVPSSSAVLDLQSTTKGFLPPRMTTNSRTQQVTKTEGLIVYDTDLSLLFICKNNSWRPFGEGQGIVGVTTDYVPVATSSTSLTDSVIYQEPVSSNIVIGGTTPYGKLSVENDVPDVYTVAPTSSNTILVAANVNTSSVENKYSNLSLQINPDSGTSKVIGDLKLVRETAGSSNSFFLFSALRSDSSYQQFLKLGYERSSFVSDLSVGTASGETASLFVKGRGTNVVFRADGSDGNQLMFLDKDGNLGIGTSTLNAKLHITQLGSSNDAFRVDDQETDTTYFLINKDGNIGVGTSAADTSKLLIKADSTSTNILTCIGTTTGIPPAFVVTNSGYVGINTATPASNLHVNGTINASSVVISGDLTVNGNQTILNTETVLIKDNIILLNSSLLSTSIPALDAGFEVNRGAETNALLIWNEENDIFKCGFSGNLKQIAQLQNNPIGNAVGFYNSVSKDIQFSSSFTFDPSSSIFSVSNVNISNSISISKSFSSVYADNSAPLSTDYAAIIQNSNNTNGISQFSALSLQINSPGTISAGKVVGDLRVVRQASNSSDCFFLFSAYRQDSTYKDFFKIGFDKSHFVSDLGIGTSDPAARFHVKAKDGTTNLMLVQNNDLSKNVSINSSCMLKIGLASETSQTKAILQISSSDQGILIPRMTTVNRDTYVGTSGSGTSLPNGLMIYNTDQQRLNTYSSDFGWATVGTGNLTGSLTLGYIPLSSGSNSLSLSLLYQSTGGSLGVGTTSPNEKAILDLSASQKGFLPPIFATVTARDSTFGTTGLTPGMVIFNSQLNTLNVCTSTTAWMAVGTGNISGTLTLGYVPLSSGSNSLSLSLLYQSSGGSLGVGTTSPNEKAILDLSASQKGFLPPIFATVTTRDSTFGTTGLTPGMVIFNSQLNTLNVCTSTSTWMAVGTGNISGTLSAGYVPLSTDSTSLTSSVLYQTSSNIGIGTTAPAEKLDVIGNIKLSNNLTVGSSATISSNLSVGTTATSATNNLLIYSNNTSSDTIATIQATQSGRNAVQRIYSQFDGSNIASGSAILQLANKDASGGLPDNCWYMGLDASSAQTNGSTPPLRIGYGTGSWAVPSSNDLFTVQATGNVGIGNSNPSSKLQVNGTTTINGDLTVTMPLYEYPPSSMTSNSTTLSGQLYGNGTYTASSSTSLSSLNLPFQIFDKNTSIIWSSASGTYTVENYNYYSKVPGASFTDYTILSAPLTYFGEWVQIQLPTSIKLENFTLQVTDNSAPKDFAVFGSTEGSTWELIARFTDQTFGTSKSKNFVVNSSNLYIYFRIGINKRQYFVSSSFVSISEWIIYGTSVLTPTLYVTNDTLGIGTTTPLAKLHIVQTGSSDVFRVDDQAADTTFFRIDASGQSIFSQQDPASSQNVVRIVNTNNYDALTLSVSSTGFGSLECRSNAGLPTIVFSGDTSTPSYILGRLGIGTSTPNSLAALDLSTSALAFYPPCMDETAKQNTFGTSFSEGLVIYNTTQKTLNIANSSSSWLTVGTGNVLALGNLTLNCVPLAIGTSGISDSIIFQSNSNSAISIGTSDAALNAILDLTSSSKGFLPPRMANASSISTPLTPGLMYFNTTDNTLRVASSSTAWLTVGTGNVSGTTDNGYLMRGLGTNSIGTSVIYQNPSNFLGINIVDTSLPAAVTLMGRMGVGILRAMTTNQTNVFNISEDGKTTIGGTSGPTTLSVQYSSAGTYTLNTDSGIANRPLMIQNVSTTNTIGQYSTLTLQVNPSASLDAGQAIGDLRLVRETANQSSSSFLLSSYIQTVGYKDLMKIGYSSSYFAGNLSVGTTNQPDNYAVLDLVSTSRGFLPPRLTSTTPFGTSFTEGLIYYDTTDHAVKFANSASTWVTIAGDIVSGTMTTSYVPLATSANKLGNSIIQQSGNTISVGSSTILSGVSTSDSYFLGNLCVGTTTASAKLHITQTTATASFRIDDQETDTTTFLIDDAGNVSVGSNATISSKFSIFADPIVTTAAVLPSSLADATLYLRRTTTSAPFDGSYGASIFFGDNSGTSTLSSGIAGVQTGSDEDQYGLAFFGHSSTTSDSIVSEYMRLTHDGSVGLGNATPVASFDLVGSTSSSTKIMKISKKYLTSDTSTSLSLPHVDVTSAAQTTDDITYTTTASTNSSTSFNAFNINATAWTGTDVNYTNNISGSIFQYVGSSASTTLDTSATLTGEWIQIRSSTPFKVNTYRFRTINSVNRLDPRYFTLCGSNNGITFTQLNQQTAVATPGSDTFSSAFTFTSTTFYTYFRLVVYQVNKTGTGTLLSINQLELKGVPQYSQVIAVDNTKFVINNPFITNTMNVGIGTSTPAQPLDVIGNIRYSGTLMGGTGVSSSTSILNDISASQTYRSLIFGRENTTDNAAEIGFTHVGAGSSTNRIGLGFFNDKDKMVIQADGNVGIGTTTPAQPLDVIGNIRYSGTLMGGTGVSSSTSILNDISASQTYRSLVFGRENTTDNAAEIGFTHVGVGSSTNRIGLGFFNDKDKMVIQADGTVGIGTTTPNSLMQVGTLNHRSITNGSVNNVGGWAFNSNVVGFNTAVSSTDGTITCYSDNANIKSAFIANQNGQIQFGTYAAASASNYTGTFTAIGTSMLKMVIGSNGNVGIGTTNPTGTLHVVGTTTSNVEILTLSKPFATSDNSTTFLLPPSDMTGTTLTVNDVTYTASASTASSTAFNVFSSNSTSWNGTDVNYTTVSGSAYQFTGTSISTALDTSTLLYGEWIQINCSTPFKVNSYRFRTANTSNRADPQYITLCGSNDGTTFTQLHQVTSVGSVAGNTLSNVYTPTLRSTFYTFFRLVVFQVNRVGTGVTTLSINDLQLTGVPLNSKLVELTNTTFLINPVLGNTLSVGIGTNSPASLLHIYSESTSTDTISLIHSTQANRHAIQRLWAQYDGTKTQNGSAVIQLANKLATTTPDTCWYVGLDAAAGDGTNGLNAPLKIGYKGSQWAMPGDGDIITLSTSNDVTFANNISPLGNIILVGSTFKGIKIQGTGAGTSDIMTDLDMLTTSATTEPFLIRVNRTTNTSGNCRVQYFVGNNTTTTNAQIGLNNTIDTYFCLQSGNFGIGTTTPSNKLDVAGNASVSGNVGIGTTTPSAIVDVFGPSSGTILNVKRSFDTSDSSTPQSFPPIVMTSATITVADSSFTASASTNSATAYYVFDTNDANNWIGTDTGYSVQAGSVYQYSGTSAVTLADGVSYYGEYVQIYSSIGFKVNSYRFKTANNVDRLDPQTLRMFASNEGTNFTLIDTWSLSALRENTFSPSRQPGTINFYKYYRFATNQVFKYRSGNFLTLNQLELSGVPLSSPMILATESTCTFCPYIGNVGIGTITPSNKLDVAGNASVSGNVGIGTATSAYKLNVIGSSLFNGDVITTPGTLEYPPQALTALATIITSSSYSNGTYNVIASSTLSTNYVYNSFDKSASTFWVSANNLYSTSSPYDAYIGGVTTTYNGSLSYAGEYIQIQLPQSIRLMNYSLQATNFSSNQTPKDFAIFASNNGTTWSLIGSLMVGEVFSQAQIKTYNVDTSNSFTYYRLAINKRQGFTQTNYYADLAEWRLFGNQPTTTLCTLSENVGIGTSSPANKLDVVGDASISGNVNITGDLTINYGYVTAQNYPPAALTGTTNSYSQTLSGQSYGNGSYTVSFSSGSSDTQYRKPFDKVTTAGNGWLSTNAYNTPSGIYNGAFTTNYANSLSSSTSGSYTGEWVQLQLPEVTRLQSFTIYAYQISTGVYGGTPRDFAIFGSKDGSTWILFQTFITQVSNLTTSGSYTYTLSNTAINCSYYRIAINAIVNGTGNQYTAISEIVFSLRALSDTNSIGIGRAASSAFQLDLDSDNARKTSTTVWSTGSDMRVKENIQDADENLCYNGVKQLKLKRFTWKEDFNRNITDKNVIGFIAQEVKEIFPKAVTLTEDHGYSDFHSLNVDQINKMMYGALRKVISRTENLDSDQLSILETLSAIQTTLSDIQRRLVALEENAYPSSSST